eukprot:TRINITY_DN931_c0_g1_i2.p1 TRINITY_DN931_c0_g1~~TRINITY_DN931_c0_g1_i2.p1  ORF type:complete len:324 (-),score=88.46 TRINITY_DN931_c0_g1_i2:71-1042(-)
MSRIVSGDSSNLRVEVRGDRDRDRGFNNFRRPNNNFQGRNNLKRSVDNVDSQHPIREETEELPKSDDPNKRLRAVKDAPVEVQQRNRRVFGAILGTLQQFKKESEVKAIPGREEIEHKIESKLEEEKKTLEEKRKNYRDGKDSRDNRDNRDNRDTRDREQHKDPELVRLEQVWEENKKLRANFHMTTQVQPHIYWAPNPTALPKLEIKAQPTPTTTITTTDSFTTASSSLKSVVVAPWENREDRREKGEKEKNGDVKMSDSNGSLTIVSNVDSTGATVERHVSEHDVDSEKQRSGSRGERNRDSYSERDRDRHHRRNSNDKGT